MQSNRLSTGSRRPAQWRHLAPLLLLVMLFSATFAWPKTAASAIDPSSTLECHRREYTYKVVRADSLGRKCWDFVKVMSCWGRCDSNEIADWQFPFKMSHHPVCMHAAKRLRTAELRNCEEEAEPGTSVYEYYDAASCQCQTCRSSQANCEGLHQLTRTPTA